VSAAPHFDLVVPTVGRPSLSRLMQSLAQCEGPAPARLLVVDDRTRPGQHVLEGSVTPGCDVEVLTGSGKGPAAARNTGWRAARSEWVAFLDDDVVVTDTWLKDLANDLLGLDRGVAGSQGRIMVPLPQHRPPTDWERNVKGLEEARWATADMAYRRSVLSKVGGFDERFRRAYREDSDLGLRVTSAGHKIVPGNRRVLHPPGPERFWASVRLQAGNADDALMRHIHGPDWRMRAGAPQGRFQHHAAITVAGVAAVAGALAGRRWLSFAAGAAWLAGSEEFAWARISPGPRSAAEVAKMVVTSAVIPPAAVTHRLWGTLRCRAEPSVKPAGVLIDRDGTLVVDVPYNGDPGLVQPMEGARSALDRLRRAGIPIAVVSNQSGVARGMLSMDQVEAVNRRIEDLLGPLGPWVICPHGPEDGCNCRKPLPGLVFQAASVLNVKPEDCTLIGDIGADVDAARAAGARAILVPGPATLSEEIESAPEVAPNLDAAVDLILGAGRNLRGM
jgi:HAD superfamily hydrolase (TIGR01662 family)